MRSRLLHPATIIATVALLVALSGSVFAATTKALIGTAQLKNGAVTLKKISPGAQTALKGAQGPAGIAGVRGAPGAAGAIGATGPAGAVGPAGSARAYAFVSSLGTVDAARSKNITASRISAGIYCVQPSAGSGIVPTTAPVLVTPEFVDGGGSFHIAQYWNTPSIPSCLQSVGWVVRTDNFSAGAFALTDIAFSVVIP
jgi:hypothetical protein